jgi:glyoxylase-like metal-dependent hydrolase (beta-lactamase superfamily II)
MFAELYAIEVGHLTIPLAFLLAGRDGTIKVPLTSYLIRHPKGTVVFDTGVHPDTHVDPEGHIGEFLFSFHDFDVSAGEDIGARLEAIDADPASVTHVVNSHLHFDHCGGNAQLANASIVVQRDEWNAAFELGNARGYVSSDFDTGQPLQLIDGAHDLFDDDSVTLFPTSGHTPGHQSALVRTETNGDFVLCGDACYLKENLETMALPGIVADPDAVLASYRRFGELQRSGAQIMYGHDPEFWTSVPRAPVRLG